MALTLAELLRKARRQLAEAGIADAALDARLLVEHFSGTTRTDAITDPDRLVDAGTTDDIQAACSSTPFPTVSVLGGESLGRVSQLILSDISSSGAETTIPAL